MTEAIDNLRALGNEVQRIRKQMKDAAKDAVAEGTKAIFAEYGDILHSFGWAQYAPYFNDGDPCEFSMWDLVLVAKVDVEREELDPEGAHREYTYESSPAFDRAGSWNKNSKLDDPRYADCAAACKVIYDVLDDDIAREIFGDDVLVVFTAEGVDTEHYAHD